MTNKILILFHSRGGNTAKMADYVAAGANAVAETEVRVRTTDDATPDDVLWCEGIAVGSPTNMGLVSWPMKKFWDETMCDSWMKVDGKIGCAFSSSGGWGGGNELACQSILTVLMNFGFLVFGVTDYVSELGTAHYGAVSVREPRSTEQQDACRILGQRLAEWVAVFVHGKKDLHPSNDTNRRGPS